MIRLKEYIRIKATNLLVHTGENEHNIIMVEVNEQRNNIILYTYIHDIQLIKGSIYHIPLPFSSVKLVCR